MKIEGNMNVGSVICLFLAHEYAFEIEYLNKIVRVGHHKGTWSFAKVLGGTTPKLDDCFEWRDCFSGCVAENDVTHGLIEQTILRFDTMSNNDRESEWHRHYEAKAICEVLKIWGGNFNKILRINVIQPERNSYVDQKTGKLTLS